MLKTAVVLLMVCCIYDATAQDISIGMSEFSDSSKISAPEPKVRAEGALERAVSARYPHYVSRVVNGDTISVEGVLDNVQLIGIDAQEPVNSLCFGGEARQYVINLIQGKPVRLVRVPRKDEFGRILAYVWFDNDGRDTCLNELMVKEGMARVNPAFLFPERIEYILLQKDARRELKGFWKHCLQPLSPSTDLGKFINDGVGNNHYIIKDKPDVLIRTTKLGNGSYLEGLKYGTDYFFKPDYGYTPFRKYRDGTIVTHDGYLVRVEEGGFGPDFKLRDIQRLMSVNPELSIQDFIAPAKRSNAYARVYPWIHNRYLIW